MQFINLTPHAVNITEADGSIRTISPSGVVPRLATVREQLGTVDGIAIFRTEMGEPEGLPQPQEGVVLIVSALVAEHRSVADRTDLAYPGEAIRDDAGRIVGCHGLSAGPAMAAMMRPAG